MGSKKYYIANEKELWKLTSNGVYKLCSPHTQNSCDSFYLEYDAPREFLQSLKQITKDKFYELLDNLYKEFNDYWIFKNEYYFSGKRFNENLDEADIEYLKLKIHSVEGRSYRMVYYLGKPYWSKFSETKLGYIQLYDITCCWHYQGTRPLNKCSVVFKAL